MTVTSFFRVFACLFATLGGGGGGWSYLGTYLLASEMICAMLNSCNRVSIGCSMVEFHLFAIFFSGRHS